MTRLVLAPGLRVLRRSRSVLQVGLAPAHRVLLPDTEPVRRTLAALLRGDVAPEGAGTEQVLDALAPVLVDAEQLVVPGITERDVAAAALADCATFADRLAARRRTPVTVSGTLGDVDPGPLLDAAGVRVTDAPDPAPPALVLVLSVGEIDRAELDPWVRAGVPHLPVRMVEGTAVVGPFVEPGRTACVRCLDAHAEEADPRHAVLTLDHSRAATDRTDGVAEPVDTALATIAVAWAVRDAITHLDGERPSTWSATVQLGARLSTVTQAQWLRHPACGCTWLADEHLSSTMKR
jgi:bacteriocin biosynthesis cyclodehydratase domain-containing protein